MTLRCLTVKQPWAWAIGHAGKTVENRTWMPRHLAGELGIHAGAAWDRGADDDPRILAAAYPGLRGGDVPHLWPKDERFVRSAVIAVVTLDRICACDGSCSSWAVRGQLHWTLTNVRPLEVPVPVTGALGLWPLPEEAEAAVRAQLTQGGTVPGITHENHSSRKLPARRNLEEAP